MFKQCECGFEMDLTLRRLVFQKKIEITNVPVYTCSYCGKQEIVDLVKNDFSILLAELNRGKRENMVKERISFSEYSAVAKLLEEYKKENKEFREEDWQNIVAEQRDFLLDLLLLAKANNDQLWLREIKERLDNLKVYA